MSVFYHQMSLICHKAAAYIPIITAVQLIDVWQILDNQMLLYTENFLLLQTNEIKIYSLREENFACSAGLSLL